MKTSIDFWKEHEGHEKKIPGKEFPETPNISSGGYMKPGIGEAKCPLCNITEIVIMDDRICACTKYGQHIKIRCKKCGVEGFTKNIKWIGARTLFIRCNCETPDYEHVCGMVK